MVEEKNLSSDLTLMETGEWWNDDSVCGVVGE